MKYKLFLISIIILLSITSCSTKYTNISDAIKPYVEKYDYPIKKDYYKYGNEFYEYENYTYYWSSTEYVTVERKLSSINKKWYIDRSTVSISKE